MKTTKIKRLLIVAFLFTGTAALAHGPKAPQRAPIQQDKHRGAKPLDDCEDGGDCVHGPNFPPDPTDPGGGGSGGSGTICHWIWIYGVPLYVCGPALAQ